MSNDSFKRRICEYLLQDRIAFGGIFGSINLLLEENGPGLEQFNLLQLSGTYDVEID